MYSTAVAASSPTTAGRTQRASTGSRRGHGRRRWRTAGAGGSTAGPAGVAHRAPAGWASCGGAVTVMGASLDRRAPPPLRATWELAGSVADEFVDPAPSYRHERAANTTHDRHQHRRRHV